MLTAIHAARPPDSLKARDGDSTAAAAATATTTSLPPSSTVTNTPINPTSTGSQLTLPSGTIVALGLGFVAAAICVVLTTILLRILQVRRAARSARTRGEQITYRQMWQRWGGWWGLMFAQTDDLHSRGLYGGRRIRIKVKHLETPIMWEIPLQTTEDPQEWFDYQTAQPLSASPYHISKEDDDVAFSVLVLMPTPPKEEGQERDVTDTHRSSSNGGDDDDELGLDLPDIMLGTTHVTPSTTLVDAGIEIDKPDDIEVEELEYAPGPTLITPLQAAMYAERRRSAWPLTWGLDGGRPGI